MTRYLAVDRWKGAHEVLVLTHQSGHEAHQAAAHLDAALRGVARPCLRLDGRHGSDVYANMDWKFELREGLQVNVLIPPKPPWIDAE